MKRERLILSNRAVYTLIAFGIIVIFGIGVYAYNSSYNNPAVFGHSADEIEGVCLSNGTNCPSSMFNGTPIFITCTNNQSILGHPSAVTACV